MSETWSREGGQPGRSEGFLCPPGATSHSVVAPQLTPPLDRPAVAICPPRAPVLPPQSKGPAGSVSVRHADGTDVHPNSTAETARHHGGMGRRKANGAIGAPRSKASSIEPHIGASPPFAQQRHRSIEPHASPHSRTSAIARSGRGHLAQQRHRSFAQQRHRPTGLFLRSSTSASPWCTRPLLSRERLRTSAWLSSSTSA